MSDFSTTVVFPWVSERDRQAAAERARAWLLAGGYIDAGMTECVLEGLGHAPGPRFERALEAPRFAGQVRGSGVNGVEIKSERAVYWALDTELTCPSCGETFVPDDEAWMSAVGAWNEGDDDAAFACPACGKSRPLRAWDGPFPWGFGYVAVTFCNWPELAPDFVRGLGEAVGGPTATSGEGARPIVVRTKI